MDRRSFFKRLSGLAALVALNPVEVLKALKSKPQITATVSEYNDYYNKEALRQLEKTFKFAERYSTDVLPLRTGKTIHFYRYTLLNDKSTLVP